jgi:hypothetical protein
MPQPVRARRGDPGPAAGAPDSKQFSSKQISQTGQQNSSASTARQQLKISAKTAREALFTPPENQTNNHKNSLNFTQIIYAYQRTNPNLNNTVWNQRA